MRRCAPLRTSSRSARDVRCRPWREYRGLSGLAPVGGPDRRRVGLAGTAADDHEHRRRLERDRLALDARAREEDVAGRELDLLAVAHELRAALDDEIELLLLLALAELVVRDDQQLAFVRLESVHAERPDTQEPPHVVGLPVVVRELLAGLGPALEDVRGALGHRLPVALDREAGNLRTLRNLAPSRHS